MKKRFVQSAIGVSAQDVNPRRRREIRWSVSAFGAGQVADRAGNHRYAVTFGSQEACKFVVPRAAGFIERGKRLMDEQDVHEKTVARQERLFSALDGGERDAGNETNGFF